MTSPNAQSDRFGPTAEEARPFDETERLIAGLPVREPSAALDERVHEAIGVTEVAPPIALPWVRRTWATAAVVLLGLGIGVAAVVMLQGEADPGPSVVQDDPPAPPSVMTASADPEPLVQVFVATEPTGRFVINDGRAMEAVRVTAVHHTSFVEDGVTYDVAQPVEQVVYVPASYD